MVLATYPYICSFLYGCMVSSAYTNNYLGVPDEQLNPKKKVWERIKPDLHTDENRVAMYKDDPFRVEGKGICAAPTLANVNIT